MAEWPRGVGALDALDPPGFDGGDGPWQWLFAGLVPGTGQGRAAALGTMIAGSMASNSNGNNDTFILWFTSFNVSKINRISLEEHPLRDAHVSWQGAEIGPDREERFDLLGVVKAPPVEAQQVGDPPEAVPHRGSWLA